jgi:16S rRNA (guanine527-N7)-methyltransferase
VPEPDLSGPLIDVLERARELGFLGPGPVAGHLRHSQAFVAAWASIRDTDPTAVADLGSGGGVPGLALALAWPEARMLLLDGSDRRAAFLREAVHALGLSTRVTTVAQRAEETGHSTWRGAYELVTARGFGPPAVTAECGGALLAPGGILAVAEPPGSDPARWPAGPLTELGLEAVGLVSRPATIQLLRRTGPFPSRYPRRVGIPAKRPLWR